MGIEFPCPYKIQVEWGRDDHVLHRMQSMILVSLIRLKPFFTSHSSSASKTVVFYTMGSFSTELRSRDDVFSPPERAQRKCNEGKEVSKGRETPGTPVNKTCLAGRSTTFTHLSEVCQGGNSREPYRRIPWWWYVVIMSGSDSQTPDTTCKTLQLEKHLTLWLGHLLSGWCIDNHDGSKLCQPPQLLDACTKKNVVPRFVVPKLCPQVWTVAAVAMYISVFFLQHTGGLVAAKSNKLHAKREGPLGWPAFGCRILAGFEMHSGGAIPARVVPKSRVVKKDSFLMPLSLTGHCATQSQLDLKIPGVPTAFPFHAAFWSGAPMLLKHRHLPYLVTRSRAWICLAPSTPKATGTSGVLKRWKWMRMRLSSFSESMSNFWGVIFSIMGICLSDPAFEQSLVCHGACFATLFLKHG